MIKIRLYWTALQSIDNNKTLDCPMDTCLSGSDVKNVRPIWTGKNAFLKRVHPVLHSWGGLEESGGMWCWGVVSEMWPDSQVGFVRPAFPTFPTDQRAALTPRLWPFPRPVLIQQTLFLLCWSSALACFLAGETWHAGLGYNVSRLRRWWCQWRWQWW